LFQQSQYATVFCASKFLSSLGDIEADYWIVKRNGEPVAGAVVIRRSESKSGITYHLCPYQGFLVSRAVTNAPTHRRSRWTIDILSCLIGSLVENYSSLRFGFHPEFEDFRPFLWHDYHDTSGSRFDLTLRYTGLIPIGSYPSFDEYLATLPQTRRYEYRQATKRGYIVAESWDIATLARLHEESYSRQGLRCSLEELQSVRNVANAALKNNLGKILVCLSPEGEIASAALFMVDHRWGYHVTGGNALENRADFSGTLLFLEYLRQAHQTGIEAVDVIGMNSPARSAFKASFNAQLTPYMVVTWKKNNYDS
jgi:hypothetical protein